MAKLLVLSQVLHQHVMLLYPNVKYYILVWFIVVYCEFFTRYKETINCDHIDVY